jgi:myo-inositol-1(or 4)-monophosphatase
MTDPAAPAPRPDPAELLAIAERLAAEAAELLVDGLGRARATVDTKSTGTDMVTEMDRASERLIVDGLLAARPDDGVLGEEGTDREGTSGVRWVVDPLDGTTNYLYGHPGFAVSIGVQIDGTTVAGVVSDPLHGDVFTATLGGGAFRNGRPIVVSAETELGRALVATGFSYRPERRAVQAAVLTRILPKLRDIRRMGAASVDLCSVAYGRADAYYERGLQPWDHVAGALVARESGALVGHLDGGPEDDDFILAAPPALYEPLRALLTEAGAADPWPGSD